MILTNYQVVTLISNLFSAYTIYKFMNVFFDEKNSRRFNEFISYVIYFFIISFVFLQFDTPFINLAINISMFLFLTFNYKANLKNRLLSTIFIYAILLSAESTSLVTLKMFGLGHFTKYGETEYIIAQLFTRIFSYVIVMLLSNNKRVREMVVIDPFHWIAIFVVPIGTLFPTFYLLTSDSEKNLLVMTCSCIILFGINAIIFYLYDNIIELYKKTMENRLLEQQSQYYVNQLNISQESDTDIRIVKHDMKQHLLTLKSLVTNGEYSVAIDYMNKMEDIVVNKKLHVQSGNSCVDSVLNSKIQHAINNQIDIKTNIKIPPELNIDNFDITIIFGNIMDNAIDATMKCHVNRKIILSVEYERNILYITISNPYCGLVVSRDGRYKTTKENKKNHGWGLISVGKAVAKYNGAIDIENDDNVFTVDIMMYNIVKLH